MTGFILNSALLGAGLAMDAFTVSVAKGLNEPHMGRARRAEIAGVYALFQFAMPLAGWLLVHTALTYFLWLKRAVPWIAFFLLLCIGGKMALEGVKERTAKKEAQRKKGTAENGGKTDLPTLLLQGVATSVDALSVGFAIAYYDPSAALAASAIIACVTFFLCLGGLRLGKRLGTLLSSYAGILGGCILIAIGCEILFSSLS